MPSILIDHRGEATRKTRELDELRTEILNDGSVCIIPRQNRLIVASYPLLVRTRTLVGVFRYIFQRRPERVQLVHYNADRREFEIEILPRSDAFRRIEVIVAAAEAASPFPRGMLAGRLSLDTIDRVAGARLVPLLDAWHAASGKWSAELYGRLQDLRLLNNVIVARNPRRSSDLIIEYWGKNINLFGAKWLAEAPGKQFEEQPYDVGRWAVRSVRGAIMANEPHLEEVWVKIVDRQFRGRDRLFERLVLPWEDADSGEAIATTVSIFRKSGGIGARR